MGKSIDYGMGQTNIGPENGIRYGVISARSILQAWSDSAEASYGEATCPKCGNPAEDIDKAPEGYGDLEGWEDNGNDYCCLNCRYTFESEEAFGDEPIGWVYIQDGYEAGQNHDDSDVWVTQSPYYTRAQFCSPCAPGACHLDHPTPEGEKAYCFGHDWFEGGVAPYPVYRVKDDTLVVPE